MLAQPAALLPLVAEQLRDREPADRLPEPVGARRDHARQCRRHLRPQRDLPPALVLEAVELPDDLVAALGRVQLQRLEWWPVVLLEAVPGCHRPPGREDVRPDGMFGRERNRESPAGLGVAWATRYQREGSGVRGRSPCRSRLAQGSSPSRCITSPTVWNEPVTSTVPAPSCASVNRPPEIGIYRPLHQPSARRAGSRSHASSASRFHAAADSGGRHCQDAACDRPVEVRSISGQSLSPRIATIAWIGPGGRSASSAVTRVRTPSGLCATSKR